ncbi:GerMN domain-containing protein [Cryptosporangium minutisporangium]|uniref:GerMN domain-containing protein n=1 Tax=Cryptosporangium minutisporangium TaxID=113569 RepID=A0ABP6T4Y2_9ACTN
MRRRLSAAILVVVTALTLTGCGVPLDDEPRSARRTADSGASLPSASPGVQPGSATERICLVRDGALTPVIRRVRPPISADTHLRLLLQGPDAVEQNSGYTSALAATRLATGATQDGGIVTVDLGDQYREAGRTDDVLAFGQIVCTLTSRLAVGAVRFVQDGKPLPVPRGDASLTAGPLTIADYADLLVTE